MPPLSQLPLFSFNTLELDVEVSSVGLLFFCMSLTALQDTVQGYICMNSLTKYLYVPKTTVEADARNGYENEDGDEEMVDILSDDAGHPKRVWIRNECTKQVAHSRKSYAVITPKKPGVHKCEWMWNVDVLKI